MSSSPSAGGVRPVTVPEFRAAKARGAKLAVVTAYDYTSARLTDDAGVDAFAKRYPKAVIRNFDGKAGPPTEMDALVAYLQMLGTLVDFKLFNEKANLR